MEMQFNAGCMQFCCFCKVSKFLARRGYNMAASTEVKENLLSLPVDILEYIWRFMPGEEWAKHAKICRTFKALSETESLWEIECGRRFGITDRGEHASWRAAFVEWRNFGFLQGTWTEVWVDIFDRESITFPAKCQQVSDIKLLSDWVVVSLPQIQHIADRELISLRLSGGWAGMIWDYFLEIVQPKFLHPTASDLVRQECAKRNVLALYVHRDIDNKIDGGMENWFIGYLAKSNSPLATSEALDPRELPYLYADIRPDPSVNIKRATIDEELEWPDGQQSLQQKNSVTL